MKKNCILITILPVLLVLASCSRGPDTVNILTNDLFIILAADWYNASHDQSFVNVEYHEESPNDQSIFSHAFIDRNRNYDLLTGSYHPSVGVATSKLSVISTKKLQVDEEEWLDFVYKSHETWHKRLVPYAIDIPVIVALNSVIPKDKTDDIITKDEFIELADSSSVFTGESIPSTLKKLRFVPSLSYFREIDYYFILGSTLEQNGRGVTFNTEASRAAFKFYHDFDTMYNPGKHYTDAYLRQFNHIDQRHYLKKKILSVDFMPMSKALTISSPEVTIMHPDFTNHTILENRVIALTRYSKNKIFAHSFIAWLLSREVQRRLYDLSKTSEELLEYRHLPVCRTVLNDLQSEGVITRTSIDVLENSCIVDFHSPSMQEKFFASYDSTIEMIATDVISRDSFLEYFTFLLNK
jgi:hypothetical protein